MDESPTVRIQLSQADRSAEADGRAAALIVIRGPELGRRFTLRPGSQEIGRRPDLPISILDPSLSRRHCAVELRSGSQNSTYVLRDLGSTNGTYVNGRRADDHVLQDGDKVTIGDVVLKFVLLDTVEEHFHHELADLIRSDRSTGLLNVEAFYVELDKALYRARVRQERMTVVMTDIDGLKAVNDAHGHLMGSKVIRTVALLMREAVERVHGAAAVYGGDEFIALLPNQPEADGLAIVDEVRQRIADTAFQPGQGRPIQVTMSAGVAEFPRDGTVREVLVRRADLALYAAKHAGRNTVRAFRPELEGGS